MTTDSTIPAGWTLASMEVSETVEQADKTKKRVKLGTVKVPTPTLAALGITAEVEQDEDTKQPAKDDYGLPVYKGAMHDIIQTALRSTFFIIARNRLQKASIQLQDGKSFPTTFEEAAASSGGQTGEHLKAFAEAANAFAAHVAAMGKTAQVVALWKKLYRDPDAMTSQSATNKEKGLQYLSGFAEGLEPDMLARYTPSMTRFNEACQREGVDPNDM